MTLLCIEADEVIHELSKLFDLRAHGFEGEDDARRFCSAFVTEDAVCIPVPHK